MLKGRTLYSEIFYNHQPLIAYISYLIQLFSHPINIYELVLRHRQFIFVIGFLMNFLLIWRFKWIGIGFTLLYEFSKFYVFGDRFLSEGIIVYPIVYMTGLVLYKFKKEKIYSLDYLLSAIFAWFVIFMREPQTLSAIALYLFILYGKPVQKIKIISVFIFLILTLTLLKLLPINDYIFSVFINNFDRTAQEGGKLTVIIKGFFYPLFILFNGSWNIFRNFLVGFDLIFLSSFILYFVKFNNKKLIAAIFIILGLANLRPEPPGTIFYEAFHMLPWYAAFIFVTIFLVNNVFTFYRKTSFILSFLLIFLFIYITASSNSFTREKIDMQSSFLTHYGNYLQIGEVVRNLSNSNDTLFTDGADELIYWQAQKVSPYKYSFYYRDKKESRYYKAREEMFAKNPPDFYYDFCTKEATFISSLPKFRINDYQRLYSGGKPSCLYIKKSKIPQVPKSGWEKAKTFLFYLPNLQ